MAPVILIENQSIFAQKPILFTVLKQITKDGERNLTCQVLVQEMTLVEHELTEHIEYSPGLISEF